MGLKAVAKRAPVYVIWNISAGEATDKHIFVADRDYQIAYVAEVHDVVQGSGTMAIERLTSGTDTGSGTDVLASTFALDSTVDIPVIKTLANGGILGAPTSILKEGECLGVDLSATPTSYEGSVTIRLEPVTGS